MFEALTKRCVHQQALQALIGQLQACLRQPVLSSWQFNSLVSRIGAHAHALTTASLPVPAQICDGLDLPAMVVGLHHSDRTMRQSHYQALLSMVSVDKEAASVAAFRQHALMLVGSDRDWCDPAAPLASESMHDPLELEWLLLAKLTWTPALLQTYRRSALAGTFKPGLGLSQLLLSHDVSTKELMTSWEQSHFPLVFSGLLCGFQQQIQGVESMLLQRFVDCQDPRQQALLLSLAGLSRARQWWEPCAAYCAQHPGQCESVLSHFIDKSALSLVAEIMALPQCTQAAHRAWCHLTQHPVTAESREHCDPNRIGVILPDWRLAESHRQSMQKRPGDCILAGRSFAASTLSSLNNHTGIAVAHLRQFLGQSILSTPPCWRLAWGRDINNDPQ